jgi:RNA polymerase subunit RPABC4/transcription elongation factor Spt4
MFLSGMLSQPRSGHVHHDRPTYTLCHPSMAAMRSTTHVSATQQVKRIISCTNTNPRLHLQSSQPMQRRADNKHAPFKCHSCNMQSLLQLAVRADVNCMAVLALMAQGKTCPHAVSVSQRTEWCGLVVASMSTNTIVRKCSLCLQWSIFCTRRTAGPAQTRCSSYTKHSQPPGAVPPVLQPNSLQLSYPRHSISSATD